MGRVDYRQIHEIYHYGTKRHSGRYPYGSGNRPHQHDGRAGGTSTGKSKEEKRAKRKEVTGKALDFTRKAVWTGIAVALKVLASTAITSATLAGIGLAGMKFLESPECQQLIQKVGIIGGNFLFKNVIEPNAKLGAQNIDNLYLQGMNYLDQADVGMNSVTWDNAKIRRYK